MSQLSPSHTPYNELTGDQGSPDFVGPLPEMVGPPKPGEGATNSSMNPASQTGKDSVLESIRDSDSQSVGDYAVAEIGKPFRFSSVVDPEERTYRFLSTRMNVLDLYPCNFGQAYLYNQSLGKSVFKYAIGYEKAMARYKKMTQDYIGSALTEKAPSALRLFLTDDTVVTDGVSTNYRPNFFQGLVDGMSRVSQSITDVGRSLHSHGYNSAVDKGLSQIDVDSLKSKSVSALGMSNSSADIMGGIVDQLKEGAAIVLKGNKLSLPKIWDSSNYSPTFSASTKLFSPYGSPKAVQEFIIKPLTLLLLMGVPHSEDFVSYGRPFALTIRSWGSAYLTLGGITAITLQRGGTDTVYNIYKQPLIINVNVEFTSLVDGVAAFATDNTNLKIDNYERNSFAATGNILTLNSKSQSINGEILPTVMPTLGGLIRSMQPVQFDDLTTGYGPTKSTRDNTMIGGNGSGDFGSLGALGDIAGGVATDFNSAYRHATDSALLQSDFGGSFLDGVLSAGGALASGITAVTANVSKTLGGVSQLAAAVNGGSYPNTDFSRTLDKLQAGCQRTQSATRGTYAAVNNLNNNIGAVTRAFGSLLNAPVRS